MEVDRLEQQLDGGGDAVAVVEADGFQVADAFEDGGGVDVVEFDRVEVVEGDCVEV